MKKFFPLLFILYILLGCHSSKRTESTSGPEPVYFEGEIHYSISYDSLPDYLNEKYLQRNLGVEMILVYKNGNQRKEFYSENGELLSTRYLDLQQNKSFSFQVDEDTVTWFDIRKPDTHATFSELSDTIIGNNDYLVLYTTVRTPNPSDKKKDFEVKTQFINSEQLPVNPEWFSNYREGNFNELIGLTKSMSIETHTYGPFWNTSYVADSIIWRTVKDKEVEVEQLKGRPMIEL